MKLDCSWEKDGFRMRPARMEEAERYYEQNFNPLDPETARMTGCKAAFSREEVLSFFRSAVESPDCCLFLVFAPGGRMIGESVINEIDFALRCANFRIAIYRPAERGRGIGSWMVQTTRDFAFEVLKLHRLSLDVFSFNTRAEQVYRKTGFQQEGVLRDAVLDGGQYADDILMSMLEEDWKRLKGLL